jgi:hypothetical protein
MDQSTIIRRPRQRWMARIAAFVVVLLGLFAIAVPAYSGEYYEPESYPASGYQYVADRYVPAPYYQGARYRSNCCDYPRPDCCDYPVTDCCRYPVTDCCRYPVTDCCRYARPDCCGYRRPDCCGYRRPDCCGVTIHGFERKVVQREYYKRIDFGGQHQPYRSYGYAEPGWSGYPAPSGYEESRPPFPYIGYAGMRGPSPRDGYEFEPRRPPADVGIPSAYYYNGYPE